MADILPQWKNLPPAQRFLAHWTELAHWWTLPWYALRRGICPHCGELRSQRAPLVELATMGLFLLVAWRVEQSASGTPVTMAIGFLYVAFLLAVLVIDLEQRRVLNIMLGPAVALTVAAQFLLPQTDWGQMLMGGAVGFGLFLLLALVGRGALGAGDVKLAGVIGLMVGYPLVLPALIIGATAGALSALWLLFARKASRKMTMAYAPYLVLGALVGVWGVLGR
jgi:prepilin signal peptidase PulO-like enzyme (type II secretory pathway)